MSVMTNVLSESFFPVMCDYCLAKFNNTVVMVEGRGRVIVPVVVTSTMHT